MADLLSGGVTRGLVGAAAYMENAKVCMAVYTAAKASNDEATMERALGYASDSMGSAMDAAEESRTALAENVKNARDEEKADQADRLEKIRKEAAEKRAEKQTDAIEESANRISEPADVIEISQEAIAALQNKQSGTEEQSGVTTDYVTAQTEKQKEKPLIEKEPRQTASMKIDGVKTGKAKHGSLDIKL